MKVVDPETRAKLSTGQVGLLLVRGPGVCSGYMADDQSTRAAFDADGYFNTGDLAMVSFWDG